MGWFDGFPFKTREQAAREAKEFERRIFPLGMEQKGAAQQVLEDLLDKKLSVNEKMFAFISAKDLCYKEEDFDNGLVLARKHLEGQRWLSLQDREYVLTLIVLENNIPSLDRYPTAQQVKDATVIEE